MKKSSAPISPKSVVENYRAIGLSCIAGILITAGILLLAAFVIASVDFPQSGIAPVAMAASVIGCFSAGFICSRMVGSGGMLYGFVCGAFIFLLTLLCEFSFLKGEMGVLAAYKFLLCTISAMIGGILGVNKRRKVR